MPLQLQRKTTASHRSSRQASTWYEHLGKTLVSDRARFIALACFMGLVALMGGGSRADIQSLVILRPAAVLFTVYALCIITTENLREVRGPLVIVGATMLLALAQLVPLPAAVWTALPQRDVVAQLSELLGMGDIVRPLSLNPDRTWNMFFAMFVPLAAISLAAIQSDTYRRKILPALVVVGMLSAVVGFLQAIGINGLLFYEVTHRANPVGLFANKNHQSIILLWTMIAACWLAAAADTRRQSASVGIGGALSVIVLLFPLLILTGSRAGLLLTVPTFILCGWLLLSAPAATRLLHRAGARARIVVGCVVAAVTLPLLFIFGVLAFSNRDTALSRLFEIDAAEELRWEYLPLLMRMIVDFLPFGTGFGSFERVFDMYEPADMLTSRYMNQAHNDPVQFIIEGGLPGLAILLGALGWFLYSVWRVWRSHRDASPQPALFFFGAIAVWLAAGLVDYPLRTPIAAMLVATLTAQLSFLSTGLRSGPGSPGKQGA